MKGARRGQRRPCASSRIILHLISETRSFTELEASGFLGLEAPSSPFPSLGNTGSQSQAGLWGAADLNSGLSAFAANALPHPTKPT